MAMARSSPAPPLRTPDGARFTVIRFMGHGSPLDRRAARDTVPRLAAGLVGKAHHAEGGQPDTDVDLDRDGAPFGAEQRG